MDKQGKPVCFVVSPIGPDDSAVRKDANDFLELLIEPALEKYDFEVIRADRIALPSAINSDIVRLVQEAELCIIDLTNSNPNVFYECGRRHETGKPFIQMSSKPQMDKIPFDVAGIRTVEYDLSSPRAVLESVKKLQEFVEHILEAGFESKTRGDSLASLAQGIERVERKVNALLAGPQALPSGGPGRSKIKLMMKPPIQAFEELLEAGEFDQAFALLPRIKQAVPYDRYIYAIGILASIGLDKGFEINEAEWKTMLKDKALLSGDNVNMVAQSMCNYFENTGKPREGMQYEEGLFNDVLPRDDINKKDKAFVINKAGMLAWSAQLYDDCIRYTKIACDLAPEDPSYCYNLGLAYEHQEMPAELAATLSRLSTMSGLDREHHDLLQRNGMQYKVA